MYGSLSGMSDSLSVPPVGGPSMTYPVAPVTPIVGKPMPLTSSSDEPARRSTTSQGVGQRLDMLV